MDKLTNPQIQKKRAEAQQIDVSLQVGKNGVTPATIEELSAQLRKRKLVKVRLLPSSSESASPEDQVKALAEGTNSLLIETRGHTAVFFRP
ncbi:MAG TPA: YhbY family RNA-binding protein [Candidatus Thermoplasmatota archaeon]|nr:YhbY family RNA-binding protein [Candidatus Thermoplasmatota archaeon]